jgi:hypothetical protein
MPGPPSNMGDSHGKPLELLKSRLGMFQLQPPSLLESFSRCNTLAVQPSRQFFNSKKQNHRIFLIIYLTSSDARPNLHTSDPTSISLIKPIIIPALSSKT